jgi:L-asparaginase II
VELWRGPLLEGYQQGHVAVVGPDGAVAYSVGDPETVITFRSAVKPFIVAGVLASGAAEAFSLSDEEIAVMSGSHAGSDRHVAVIRGLLKRAGVDEGQLACGPHEPDDPETRTRLIREGAQPEPVRHMCSGFHTSSLIASVHAGWSTHDYVRPGHPSQRLARETLAALIGRDAARIATGTDDCGVETYAVTVTEMARAFLLLAEPEAPAAPPDARRLAPALTRVRDAMRAHPEMVDGTPGALDTVLMRSRGESCVSKEAAAGSHGVGLLRGAPGTGSEPAGVAVSAQGTDPSKIAAPSAVVETLRQLGVLDDAALEALAHLHRHTTTGPDGAVVAQGIPTFSLQPA